MNRRFAQNPRLGRLGLIAVVLTATWVSTAQPQYKPYGPKNYTDYYMKHVQNFNRPPVNIRDYTIDKYYLHNPNVSPYSMLGRFNPYGNNYYQYTRPELERRAVANAPRPKPVFNATAQVPTGVVAGPIHTAMPVPAQTGVTMGKVNPYFNKYYKNGPR